MNQIKLKIEEIGLSQREISVRLGKNASYLAGVFRSGLSTAKQAELLKDLEVVGKGGYFQSEGDIIAELDRSIAKLQDANSELQVESDRYFKVLQTAHQSYIEAQNAGIKALEGYGIARQQLTETQKYLLEANQECEQLKDKYRFVLIFNYVLSLVILGIAISWVLA